jgi:hypothetical protein
MSEGNRSDQVTLGCGSLILIALIVIFFSGSRDKEIGKDVKELRKEIESLRQSVAELKEQLRPQVQPVNPGQP